MTKVEATPRSFTRRVYFVLRDAIIVFVHTPGMPNSGIW